MSDEAPTSALEHFGPRLPTGFKAGGRELRDFTLRPLRGRFRRELLNAATAGTLSEAKVTLRSAVADLGGLGPPGSVEVDRMPMADLQYVYLSCAQLQGHTYEVPFQCTCGYEWKQAVQPGQVGFIPASGETSFTKEGDPCMQVTFLDPAERRDITMVVRLQTVADIVALQAVASKRATKNSEGAFGDAIFDQLVRTVVDYDGTGKGLTHEMLDDMDVSTLDALNFAASKVAPAQPDTDIETNCPKCRAVVHEDLEVSAWLVPFAPRVDSTSSSPTPSS